MMWFCDNTDILSYYNSKSVYFPLWVNYLLSEHRCMWTGMQPAWTHSETHLAGLEIEVDVCLFVYWGFWEARRTPLVLSYTHRAVCGICLHSQGQKRHLLLTYITTYPGRHWNTRTNERERIYNNHKHKLSNWVFANMYES